MAQGQTSSPPAAAARPRRVLLTGVTRGLGRALADVLVRHGQVVIGCGRSPGAIDALHRTFGAPHRFDAVDVADDAAVAAWARRVLDSHGAPELLFNNAGVINANAPLWQVGAEEFAKVIDVNIKGVANVIRHFVPAMVAAGTGVIVNFSSGWGRAASASVAPYCASKWAIEGMTRSLAQELPRGMAAVPLNPGIIDTGLLRSCFGSAAEDYPSPADWAERALPFLLGLDARANGRALTVP